MTPQAPRRLLGDIHPADIRGPGQKRLRVPGGQLAEIPDRRLLPEPLPASDDPDSVRRRRIAVGPLPGFEPDTEQNLPPLDPTPTDGTLTHGFLAFAVRRTETGQLKLAPAWSLWALLVLFPLWWALGLGSFIFAISAVPMVAALRRRRPLRYPPWFWLWAAFLTWTVLSLVMFTQSPSGTTPGTTGGRLIATAVLLTEYGSVTVVLLFIGNLTAAELPQRRLMSWLSSLFLVTVGGGFLGTYVPRFAFTSPTELLLPHSLRSSPYISALVHPNAAQIQSVLGSAGGRAAAPWGYTNYWANDLSLLMLWFIITWIVAAKARRRLVGVTVVVLSVVPIVYSLNRGLWIGLALTVLWVSVRLFFSGRVLALFALVAVGALGVIAFVETPLHDVYNSRLQHPESNDIRAFLTKAALDGANKSPIIGWGGTRKTIGSYSSITTGKTANCQQCGQFSIGSNGQFWLVIFYQGWVGAGFFLGFLGMTIWTYRRDRSVVAQAGVIAVGQSLLYMLFYSSLPSGMTFTMIAVALLWRSRLDAPESVGEAYMSPAPLASGTRL